MDIVCDCIEFEKLDDDLIKKIQDRPLPEYTEVYLGSLAKEESLTQSRNGAKRDRN